MRSGAGMVAGMAGAGFQESPVLPRIGIAPARAMYVGPGLRLAPHQVVATTLAVSLGEPFALRTWRRSTGWSAWQPRQVAAIPSETFHHLQSEGPMAFLYLDPLTDRRELPDAQRLAHGRQLLRAAGPAFSLATAFAAFGLLPRVPRDGRIARVIQAVEQQPQAFGRLREAADLACLSPSRFRARFDAEVGLPFRRYRMWRRMALVMRALAQGSDLTTAALACGFASSAHLSAAFKQMFGLSAREVLALGVAIDTSEDRVPVDRPPASAR